MQNNFAPGSRPCASVESADALPGHAFTHRQPAPAAVFMAELERASTGCRSVRRRQLTQRSVSDDLEGIRSPTTSDVPVQTRRRVVILFDNELEDVAQRAPSTENVTAEWPRCALS